MAQFLQTVEVNKDNSTGTISWKAVGTVMNRDADYCATLWQNHNQALASASCKKGSWSNEEVSYIYLLLMLFLY